MPAICYEAGQVSVSIGSVTYFIIFKGLLQPNTETYNPCLSLVVLFINKTKWDKNGDNYLWFRVCNLNLIAVAENAEQDLNSKLLHKCLNHKTYLSF